MSRVVSKTEISTDALEEVFGIEPNTTVKDVITFDEAQTPVLRGEDYDDKDDEIDSQFQEVYDKALTAFEYQMERADSNDIEPKYVARMHEVAAQYLNTALTAAREKANLKTAKDKLVKKNKVGGQVTNNTLVVSHADLLDMIASGNTPIKDVN